MGICRCRLPAIGCQLPAAGFPLLLPAGQYSRMQEGSGAFGARVLSFVRFAPNDGFGPESASPSGLVQRGVMYAASGGDTTTLGSEGPIKPKNL